jgi:FKBP-type peptidyl-prolyl cis-trans isomerase
MTALATLMLAGCGQDQPTSAAPAAPAASAASGCPAADANGVVAITAGLTARITSRGYGRAAVAGDYADVHTTLWLYDENAAGGRGTEIWTSGGDRPFQFQLSAGQVIKGWDLGVACMLVGETRELKIAPELGYGARGKPPVPANATLLFEIELVNLVSPEEAAAL